MLLESVQQVTISNLSMVGNALSSFLLFAIDPVAELGLSSCQYENR